MRIPSCIIYPAISPALNPTAKSYKEKINKKWHYWRERKQNMGKNEEKFAARMKHSFMDSIWYYYMRNARVTHSNTLLYHTPIETIHVIHFLYSFTF